LTIVEADNISKTYTIDDRKVSVLKNISLAVTAGEFLVVEGQSGSGKTTLLSLLSGLDKPSVGRILVDGRDITDATEDELAPMRNQFFGFVFQAFHLVPSLTALENVMFPAELNHDRTAAERARALLQRVGLSHRETNFHTNSPGVRCSAWPSAGRSSISPRSYLPMNRPETWIPKTGGPYYNCYWNSIGKKTQR
jgi:putative ABC transport system ATP-binding protein